MAIPAIRQWPMLRVFVPFASGICLQYYFQFPGIVLYSGIVVTMMLAGIFGLLPSRIQYRLFIPAGITMICFVLIGGMLVMFLQNPRHKYSAFNYELNGGKLLVRLVEEPSRKGKILKANAELLEYRLPDTSFRISGFLQISFLFDSTLPVLNPGQELLIIKAADTITDNSNPGGFDFKEYSLRQGIKHQVFLKKDDFTISGIYLNPIDRFLISIRKTILTTIRKNIKGSEESGLAEALLIGYKNDLDKGLVQSYSNTGVVHVIAISGLHLALIYWIIGKGCDLLKLNKKKVKPFVVIAGLWLFALLAGASPSVVRSAVMFTVIVAGELIRRKSHILNSLAASAFCLLCYNPLWLWDLGFQLSYIAVLSLVMYASTINNALYFKNPILGNIWSLVSVTLAAQVLTTPLTLLQFHKFPMLFLFTNCICVPLSSLLLIGELFLCCISWMHTPAEWIGSALQYGLHFMNSVVRFFEKYPFSNFQPVQISIVQTIFLYSSIALVMQWLIYRNKAAFIFFLLSLAAFSTLRSVSFHHADLQSKLIIYNIPGKMAIDFFEGRGVQNFEYRQERISDAEWQQHISNSRIIRRIDARRLKTSLLSGGEIHSTGGIRIGWINKPTTPDYWQDRPLDILIVSHNSLSKSMSSINGLKLRLVVADATNSRSALQYYSRFFHNQNIPYYSVSEQGAFVRNLN